VRILRSQRQIVVADPGHGVVEGGHGVAIGGGECRNHFGVAAVGCQGRQAFDEEEAQPAGVPQRLLEIAVRGRAGHDERATQQFGELLEIMAQRHRTPDERSSRSLDPSKQRVVGTFDEHRGPTLERAAGKRLERVCGERAQEQFAVDRLRAAGRHACCPRGGEQAGEAGSVDGRAGAPARRRLVARFRGAEAHVQIGVPGQPAREPVIGHSADRCGRRRARPGERRHHEHDAGQHEPVQPRPWSRGPARHFEAPYGRGTMSSTSVNGSRTLRAAIERYACA
jgi:hypothetical protein